MKTEADVASGREAAWGLTRRGFLVAGTGLVIGAALPLGCGGEEAGAAASSEPGSLAPGTPWAGTRKVFDLRESLHLADIDHRGEFIDFGTAARFKYSMGGWMSGWDNDTAINGISFTWATKSPSRLYFSLDAPKALTFEFRVKKGGNDAFSVYLNDKPLQRVTMSGAEWETHSVTSTADMSKAGENYFKLIYPDTESKVGGKPASFAMDYMRIIPEGTAAGDGFDPPHLATLRQTFKTAKATLDSLILNAPTTLSYYARIPAAAQLCLFAANATASNEKAPAAVGLEVRAVAADGQAPAPLFSSKYGAAEWKEEMIDLKALAGKLARIDIAVSGPPGSRLALGEPAIRQKPPAVESVTGKPKNAIILLIDTLRADKLTAYGKTRVKSAAFDKFATEAAVFESCQANSNWTKPSCASVLTGMHPDSHKARGHSSRLASSVKMASEMFLDAGFATGAFIANGYLATEFGFNRGWSKYVNYIRETKNSDAENVYKDVLEFVKEQASKPFFTYIQTIDPHVPYDPPEEDLKIYDAQAYEGPVQPRSTGNLLEEFKRKKVELDQRDRRRLEALYDGEVTYHDRHFGRFLDELAKLGALDDTVIVVCADHGEEFFEHDSVGHGHTLQQELLHVPLAIRAPGVVPRGRRLTTETGLHDILPTVLEATGLTPPKGVEGKSLIPLANGEAPDPIDASFSSFWSEADDRNLQWSVRMGDWKLRMKGPVNSYLNNLAQDPAEKSDVDEQYPVALRALRTALGQFIGAPDKSAWSSGQLASQVVGKPEAGEDKMEAIPDDLKDQLRQLGYMQ
jgi:arylsulfatase A-like enzyme